MGRQYDPLEYDQNTDDVSKIGVKMIQNTAEIITCTYVYKLNIVTIVLSANSDYKKR